MLIYAGSEVSRVKRSAVKQAEDARGSTEVSASGDKIGVKTACVFWP